MKSILSPSEKIIVDKLMKLKNEAGSHSPSIFTIKEEIPEINIKVDACFLSNPYATELFMNRFDKELIQTKKITEILEFYPSQNKIIANLLSSYLSVPAKNLFIGNGAIEIIQAVIHNFTSRKILINIPTFSSYYEFAKDDIEVIYNRLNKEDNFKINLEQYLNLVKLNKPDTVVLINPNNPDGSFLDFNSLMFLLNNLEEVDNIIIDESFIHFAYESDDLNLISYSSLILKYPNLIVIKSMSKDFGIAGIRAGYAVMNESRVAKLLKNGFLWNSNGLSEYFFRLYVSEDFQESYEIVRKDYIRESSIFFDELTKIPNIKTYPSKANFSLIELPSHINSDEFVTFLLVKYGVYARTGSDKIGLDGQFIRVASRTKLENEYIVEAIKSLIILYEKNRSL